MVNSPSDRPSFFELVGASRKKEPSLREEMGLPPVVQHLHNKRLQREELQKIGLEKLRDAAAKCRHKDNTDRSAAIEIGASKNEYYLRLLHDDQYLLTTPVGYFKTTVIVFEKEELQEFRALKRSVEWDRLSTRQPKAVADQLREIATSEGTTVENLLAEGLSYVFRRRASAVRAVVRPVDAGGYSRKPKTDDAAP